MDAILGPQVVNQVEGAVQVDRDVSHHGVALFAKLLLRVQELEYHVTETPNVEDVRLDA